MRMGSGKSYTMRNFIVYRSPNIVMMIKFRRLGWTGNVARMKEGRNAFQITAGKSTGKRNLEMPKHRWDGNIIMDLKEIGINTINWIDLTQDMDYWNTLVNSALNLRVS